MSSSSSRARPIERPIGPIGPIGPVPLAFLSGGTVDVATDVATAQSPSLRIKDLPAIARESKRRSKWSKVKIATRVALRRPRAPRASEAVVDPLIGSSSSDSDSNSGPVAFVDARDVRRSEAAARARHQTLMAAAELALERAYRRLVKRHRGGGGKPSSTDQAKFRADLLRLQSKYEAMMARLDREYEETLMESVRAYDAAADDVDMARSGAARVWTMEDLWKWARRLANMGGGGFLRLWDAAASKPSGRARMHCLKFLGKGLYGATFRVCPAGTRCDAASLGPTDCIAVKFGLPMDERATVRTLRAWLREAHASATDAEASAAAADEVDAALRASLDTASADTASSTDASASTALSVLVKSLPKTLVDEADQWLQKHAVSRISSHEIRMHELVTEVLVAANAPLLHVAPLFASIEDADGQFAFMELLQGHTVQDFLARVHRGAATALGGRTATEFGEAELAWLLFHVLWTLATLQHYVPNFRHNDMLLGNVFLAPVPRAARVEAYPWPAGPVGPVGPASSSSLSSSSSVLVPVRGDACPFRSVLIDMGFSASAERPLRTVYPEYGITNATNAGYDLVTFLVVLRRQLCVLDGSSSWTFKKAREALDDFARRILRLSPESQRACEDAFRAQWAAARMPPQEFATVAPLSEATRAPAHVLGFVHPKTFRALVELVDAPEVRELSLFRVLKDDPLFRRHVYAPGSSSSSSSLTHRHRG